MSGSPENPKSMSNRVVRASTCWMNGPHRHGSPQLQLFVPASQRMTVASRLTTRSSTGAPVRSRRSWGSETKMGSPFWSALITTSSVVAPGPSRLSFPEGSGPSGRMVATTSPPMERLNVGVTSWAEAPPRFRARTVRASRAAKALFVVVAVSQLTSFVVFVSRL